MSPAPRPGAVDFTSQITSRLAWLIIAVVAISFLLLTIAFRSVVIATKAAILNILSIGAAYGVIVAIFEWGWAKSVIGLQSTLPIPAYVPMLVFCIVFGLSMDYEVFLLSRVHEAWLDTRDAHRAVAIGIGATARVITTAAADHDRRVRQLRAEPGSDREDARHRDGVRGAHRRVAGPDVPGALDHVAARLARLVAAAPAESQWCRGFSSREEWPNRRSISVWSGKHADGWPDGSRGCKTPTPTTIRPWPPAQLWERPVKAREINVA